MTASTFRSVTVPTSAQLLTQTERMVFERMRSLDDGQGCWARVSNIGAGEAGGSDLSPRWVQRCLKILIEKGYVVPVGISVTRSNVYLLAGRSYSVSAISKICFRMDLAALGRLALSAAPQALAS